MGQALVRMSPFQRVLSVEDDVVDKSDNRLAVNKDMIKQNLLYLCHC